jgi:hypothetical protein
MSTAEKKDRGDIHIRRLWERETDFISDVRVMDTDASTYQMKDPINVLEAAERLKNNKYLQLCLDQRCHFTRFIVSVDDLIVKEAKTVLKILPARTTTESGKMYSNIMGYMRARQSILIVSAIRVFLRGSRIRAVRMSNRRPKWEETAGISLLK